MRKNYFPSVKGSPPPLRIQVERKVRFEETDPLGIVWHGRYASFFEDARTAAGEKYGFGYPDFEKNEVNAPIRILHTDFLIPLKFNETFIIEGRLHWTEAVRMNIDYLIWNAAGRLATTGYTVQVLLDKEDNLLLTPPPFFLEFREKWRSGGFQ
ncbi:MAG: acyl-CoA thioesterase [Deltaproteobacteria bacterium]|nr:acyl-CoA thioesterase [Deltaproteobacteria bacterium]